MSSAAAAAVEQPLPWYASLISLATPLLAFLGVYIANKRTSRTSADAVHVSQTEAETNQFSALTDGYVEQVRMLREEVKEQRVGRDADRNRLDKLDQRIEENQRREQEYLAHMAHLESLVPNPPGPPVRPWLKLIADQQ